MFVSLVRVVKVLVHGVDKRHANCLSSLLPSKPPGTRTPGLMSVSHFASPIW